MKVFIILVMAICLTACFKAAASPSEAIGGGDTLKLMQRISLTGVEGRIDHLSIDLKGQRLFVAALGNNTVEVIDLVAGRVIHSISGLDEPQGIIFVPEFNKIFVANGGDGTCRVFDSNTFTLIDKLDLAGDADNIRYDGRSKTIYVGYGNGGLSLIDAATDKVLGDIQLDGHPESFQLEPSDSKIFINVPSANQMAVVDSQKQKVIANWSLPDSLANYPMALDANGHRLFVGFRFPAKLNMYDSQTGKFITSLDSVGDADDIFYAASHKLIFVIGGEGYIDIFSPQAADQLQLLTRIPTAAGARTGLWVPEQNRLYVAVPHRGSQIAEIRSFELQP